MRVGIIGIQHEGNTFLDRPTTIEDFRRDVYLFGDDIRAKYAGAHHEVGGFFEGLSVTGMTAVPIFLSRAVPSGIITADAAEELLGEALRQLDRADKIDGLLVAPHGAAVSERERDFDGYWLTAIREKIGRDRPMICTLDLHANVSQRMIEACDATIGYRTNPHLDQRARGIEAAQLMARTLAGEVKPVQAGSFPPIQINIERQHTTESPCLELYKYADELRKNPRVLSNSVLLGFPYADVAEMGSSTVGVADGDRALAEEIAGKLAQHILDHRKDFRGQSVPVEAAVDQAINDTNRVCLLDMGDNVGGGSPGDGTIIAHELLRRGGVKSFVCINDPESVQQCMSAGVGAEIALRIGGIADRRHGEPIVGRMRVESLPGGKFSDHTPRHGGSVDFNMGQCAVVTAGNLTVLVTSRRTPPFSLGMMTSCNLDPKAFQVIVAKGVHAPVAAYRSVCPNFIRVDTPGITTANMSLLDYKFRRRPLYPLEEI